MEKSARVWLNRQADGNWSRNCWIWLWVYLTSVVREQISNTQNMRVRITQWRLDVEFRRANQSEASAGTLADRWENMLWKKIALLSREHTTEKRSYREDIKKFKMSTLTTNFVPQPAVYRASVDRSLKKSRLAKDVPLPEVPKVIDNGNGRRYFRGRLLGKVSFLSTMWLVWIIP